MGPFLAFDPGTHAIGWAVFSPAGNGEASLAACGVLLLPPTGENRRDAELARRAGAVRKWRRRRRARLEALRRKLEAAGLLPAAGPERTRLFAGDPWRLRARGLVAPLAPGEFGRAVLHLAARRGSPLFGGEIGAAPILRLWPRHDAAVRARLALRARRGVDAPEPPGRNDILAEFDALWLRQTPHIAVLGDDALRVEIRALAFGETGSRRRAAKPPRTEAPARSALAALRRLYCALRARFGPPGAVAWEAPLPLCRRALAAMADGQPRTQRRKARIARRDGVALRDAAAEVDHAVSLAAGGRMALDNEVLLSAADNRRKGASGARPAAPPAFARRRPRDMALIGAELKRLFAAIAPGPAASVDPAEVAEAARRFGLRPRTGKNRDDWRHNAADAVAVALAAFPGLRPPDADDVRRRAVISIAPRRKPRGRMHEETLYAPAVTADGRPAAAARKAVIDLTAADVAHVRDARLGAALRECLAAKSDRAAALAEFSRKTGVRRLRLIRPAADAILLPRNAAGAPRRAVLPKTNHAIDLVAMRDGVWRAFGVTLHDRQSKGWRPQWERLRLGGKLAMRLCKGDCVEIDAEEGRRVLRVRRLAPSNGYVWLAGLAEAGDLGRRHADPRDPFRFVFLSARGLQQRRARAVDIDPLGVARPRRTNVVSASLSIDDILSGSGEPDPEAPETGRPTATDSVCRQAAPR